VIAGLRPYPVTKESGAPSLGLVPRHWQVRRLRTAVEMSVSNVDKHAHEGELPVRLCNYVDVYKNDRIHSVMPFMRATATRDELTRFRIADGDVLITKDSESWDDIGVPALVVDSADDLVCGYHLAMLRPSVGLLSGAYLFRLIQSTGVAHQLHLNANGVTRYGLTHSGIKSVWLPVAPRDEQDLIVRFLNHADARIRRYIRAKQRLIGLLEEQRQAVINRAVTRGLDPGVQLEPSGFEWLGDVPEHWQVVALRRHWEVVDCKHVTVPFVDEGIPLASVREAQAFDLRLETANRTTPEWYERLVEGGRVPQTGDLVYCRNVSVGAAAYVDTPMQFAMGQDVCLIRSKSENGRWLNYYLRSPAMARQLAMGLIGSTFNRINVADVKNLIVPVPPRKEQDRIAAFLDGEVTAIDQAREGAEREIRLVREYRTCLIADVVTGKLDVREAAAALPDEPDVVEEIDEPALGGGPVDGADDLDELLEEVEA